MTARLVRVAMTHPADLAGTTGRIVVRTPVGPLWVTTGPPTARPPEEAGRGAEYRDEHLLADARVVDSTWLSVADVIVRSEGTPIDVHARFPGCLVAMVVRPTGPCAVGVFDGRRPVEFTVTPALAWFASILHAWVVWRRPSDGLDGARPLLPDDSEGPAFQVRRVTGRESVRRGAA